MAIQLKLIKEVPRFVGLGSIRALTFSFAGPKTLRDVLKEELVRDKTGTDVADIWYTYHEAKACNCTGPSWRIMWRMMMMLLLSSQLSTDVVSL